MIYQDRLGTTVRNTQTQTNHGVFSNALLTDAAGADWIQRGVQGQGDAALRCANTQQFTAVS